MTAPDLDEGRRRELAAVLKSHLPKDRYDDEGHPVGTYCTGCDWTGNYFADGEAGPFDDHVADALAPLIAGWLAAAEQRGREDNADHGMCYVHGSKALEAKLAAAKAEALREAADWLREQQGDTTALKVALGLVAGMLRARADRIGGER